MADYITELLEERKPQPHGVRHRWGLKNFREESPFAVKFDEDATIICHDCGIEIPSAAYKGIWEKLATLQDRPDKDILEQQNKLLELEALAYEPPTEWPPKAPKGDKK